MFAGSIFTMIRNLNGNTRSLILHFAAGVVFSVLAVEIIPTVVKNHSTTQAIIGFILGFVTMVAIKKLIGHEESEDHR